MRVYPSGAELRALLLPRAQLRVVTQEDVRFQRFRRDDVGVFELKGMIEENTNKIVEAVKGLDDNANAL